MERAQVARRDVLIAGELDLAHLDRGAFLNVEVDGDRGRRNRLDVGLDGGELVAVLGEQLADYTMVSACLTLVGSYGLSTERPTFSFLKRSRTSDCETEFRPL